MTDRPVQDRKAPFSETPERQKRTSRKEGAQPSLKDWLLAPEPRGDIPVPRRGTLRLRTPKPL